MARYIDENTAWHYIKLAMPLKEREKLLEAFKKIPTADVQEVKHGKWIRNDGNHIFFAYKRNICDMPAYTTTFNYCSSCGAKMDGVIL